MAYELINRRAEEIIREEEQRRKERDWELRKAAVLLDKKFSVWNALKKQVRENIEVWNRTFPASQSKKLEFCDGPAHGFLIRRAGYPSVTVNVRMHTNGQEITWSISERFRVGQSLRETRNDSVSIGLADDGTIYFRHGRMLPFAQDAITELLLHDVINASESFMGQDS